MIGTFFMINGDILMNCIAEEQGEEYGNFMTFSSHWDLWLRAQKDIPALSGIEYSSFPRGRVVYNRTDGKYTVYVDKLLNNVIDLEIIMEEFGLLPEDCYIDDTDEHYTHEDVSLPEVYLDGIVKYGGKI